MTAGAATHLWGSMIAAGSLVALFSLTELSEFSHDRASGRRIFFERDGYDLAGGPAASALADLAEAPASGLRATASLRQVFDAFLAGVPDGALPRQRELLAQHLLDRMSPDAAAEAFDAVDRYVDYLRSARDVEHEVLSTSERLDRLAALRNAVLGADLAAGLFDEPAAGAAAAEAGGSLPFEQRYERYRGERDMLRARSAGDAAMQLDLLAALRAAQFSSEEVARVRELDRLDSLGP